MAKIEIELDYIENLKSQNRRLEEKVEELLERLNSIDETQLIERAKNLAVRLSEKTFDKIMTELGFSASVPFRGSSLRISECGSSMWDDKNGWDVEIGAEIYKDFKRAFINIGIIPPREMEMSRMTIDSLIEQVDNSAPV